MKTILMVGCSSRHGRLVVFFDAAARGVNFGWTGRQCAAPDSQMWQVQPSRRLLPGQVARALCTELLTGRPLPLLQLVMWTAANLLPWAPRASALPRRRMLTVRATRAARSANAWRTTFPIEAPMSTTLKCVAARGFPGIPTKLHVT